jgi:hypothetical protein
MSNISEQINYLNDLFAANPDFNKLPLSIQLGPMVHIAIARQKVTQDLEPTYSQFRQLFEPFRRDTIWNPAERSLKRISFLLQVIIYHTEGGPNA